MQREYEVTPTPVYQPLVRLHSAVVNCSMKAALQSIVAELVEAIGAVATTIGCTTQDPETEAFVQHLISLRKHLDAHFEGDLRPWWFDLGALHEVAREAARLADAAAVGQPTTIRELTVLADWLGVLFERPVADPPPESSRSNL